jgi:broad specificity phosphatase PhoE
MTDQRIGIVPTQRDEAARQLESCRIFVVRHGTTTMNVENRYRGRRDIPLDAQGYQDAVDAARALSSAGVSAVYTGPLRRTIATAQIVADETRVPDLRILHGLNNVDYGAWEGMTSEEAAMYDPHAFELYRTDPTRAACPAGERLTDAQDRMVEALRLIGARHPAETVVAVTHAVMIRLAVARLGASADRDAPVAVGRGSLTEFSFTSIGGVPDDGLLRVAGLPAGDDVD